MWYPRHITSPWASTACYRDNFQELFTFKAPALYPHTLSYSWVAEGCFNDPWTHNLLGHAVMDEYCKFEWNLWRNEMRVIAMTWDQVDGSRGKQFWRETVSQPVEVLRPLCPLLRFHTRLDKDECCTVLKYSVCEADLWCHFHSNKERLHLHVSL
jgi:hypothetical protein